MSCGCNTTPCSCSSDVSCDAANETLASMLNNFITAFYGTVTKTCVNGQIIWTLPCNLETGCATFPKNAGESTACYLLRLSCAVLEGSCDIDAACITSGTIPDARLGANILRSSTTVVIPASDIDWSLSDTFSKTLSANTTFTFSNTSNKAIVVAITNTAGNFTVTWPSVRWTNGVAPTQTIGAKTDTYTFVKIGTIFYGAVVANMT